MGRGWKSCDKGNCGISWLCSCSDSHLLIDEVDGSPSLRKIPRVTMHRQSMNQLIIVLYFCFKNIHAMEEGRKGSWRRERGGERQLDKEQTDKVKALGTGNRVTWHVMSLCWQWMFSLPNCQLVDLEKKLQSLQQVSPINYQIANISLKIHQILRGAGILFFIISFIYVGYAGSLLLHGPFSSCRSWRLLQLWCADFSL